MPFYAPAFARAANKPGQYIPDDPGADGCEGDINDDHMLGLERNVADGSCFKRESPSICASAALRRMAEWSILVRMACSNRSYEG